jgi:hypothetical protein
MRGLYKFEWPDGSLVYLNLRQVVVVEKVVPGPDHTGQDPIWRLRTNAVIYGDGGPSTLVYEVPEKVAREIMNEMRALH